MHCTNCGNRLPETGRFCPSCGTPIPLQPQPVPVEEEPIKQEAPAEQGFAQAESAAPASSIPAPESAHQYQPPEPPPPIRPVEQELVRTPPQPMQSVPGPQHPVHAPGANIPIMITPPPPKKRSALPAILIAAVLLIGGAAAFLLLSKGAVGTKLPEVTYTDFNAVTEPEIEYTVQERIFPSLYRTLDSIVTLTGTNEVGQRNVLVHVEIPGFTQPFEQTVTLSRQITKIDIHPPLLTGELNLKTEKDAQVVISVKDMETGKVLLQDSRNIRIMSKYDAVWWTDEMGDSNIDNILAWMTPDAPSVLELKRQAIDYLDYISDGAANSFIGYQDYGIWENPIWNTWLQAVAIQGAMSDIALIRYNNAAFSISSDAQQRVMLPDDVMKSRSGICIETSLLMASALQSAGMHVMLIFPPGHAQVAVETWPGTGEYFLIETTTLPMPMHEEAWDQTVMYLSNDQWQGYIDGTAEYSYGECYVLDCDLAKKLNILPMSN